VVYARTLNERTLTLIVSGKLWRNSLIMQDVETGTLWSHVTGEALEGPATGQRLEALPSVQTTWEKWLRAHPGTEVLAKDREFKASAYEDYFKDPERNGLFRAQWLAEKMPGKTLVYGVSAGPHALAVTDKALKGLVSAELGETPVVVRRGADGGVRAFVAAVDGEALKLAPVSAATAKDRATGSTWDLERGAAIDGPLEGRTLEELPVTAVYWFAWSSFYPNTAVVE
jgi:hypothetical protein